MQRELSAAEYDLWAELPSPLKSGVRKAFSQYGASCFREKGILLTSYLPAAMGGSMPREDYLAGFSEKAFPDSCMIMNFGEYSDRTFFEKAAKIYEEQRICAYFPEILVVDKRRLNNRLIPKSYEELTDPVYEKELCILGMPSLPDPALALYLLRSMGEEGVEALAKNVGCFVPPSKTIRHIGKKSNVYGSIFVMPALFAQICLENPQAEVIVPQKGALAEPMLLLQKKQGRNKKEVLEFFHSDIFVSMMAEKQMPVPEDSRFSISPLCQRPFLPEEVETVLVIFQRKNQ